MSEKPKIIGESILERVNFLTEAALVAAPLLALGSLGAGTAYTWNKLRKLNDK